MNECRLCAGRTTYAWHRRVLGKHEVAYFECAACGSLQTEPPYWLDEAYAKSGVGLDTGACQRSVDLALRMSTAFQLLGVSQDRACLDYGAALGLYGRMMRDRGWNYFAYDKYGLPFYMDGFLAEPSDGEWSAISAFEVLEHLPNPAETLEQLIGLAQDYLFFTTDLWAGQGRDWHYLNPEHGQHVFFYTRAALEWVARTHGFAFDDLGFVKCFYRPTSREKVARLAQADLAQKVFQSFLLHQRNPYRYAARDSEVLMASANSQAS